jgi:glycosyltransferase involved in cell wall biosynthesis
MRVGFDVAPIALNQAGERRYATALLGALRAREDVSVEELGLIRRQPGGMAQRVISQLAAEAVYYPALVGSMARRRGVDMIHFPRHLVPPGIGRRVPTVVTVHDVLPLSHPEYFSELIRRRYRPLARAAVRAADLVLTGSRHSAGQLTDLLGVEPARVVVTPYGVEGRFRRVGRDEGWLADRFGVRSRYVLCVGTLEPRKNLVGAVRAFSRAAESVEDCVLVVAGGRGWRNEAFERELAGAPGRVVLTGFVSDEELVRLYSGADCFLFPSLAEGFGFPVLEAMACGAPVVSSDRTSLPEVVGDAGVLVDPEDERAIAAAVERVLTEPGLADRLRERGLEHAAQYTWDACAAATLAEYRRLLG